jgi:hypothetical protein
MNQEEFQREGVILWALAGVCGGVALLNWIFG